MPKRVKKEKDARQLQAEYNVMSSINKNLSEEEIMHMVQSARLEAKDLTNKDRNRLRRLQKKAQKSEEIPETTPDKQEARESAIKIMGMEGEAESVPFK